MKRLLVVAIVALGISISAFAADSVSPGEVIDDHEDKMRSKERIDDIRRDQRERVKPDFIELESDENQEDLDKEKVEDEKD